MYNSEYQFTEEFRRNAVQLLLITRKSSAQIEQEYHIPPGLLTHWRQELAVDNADIQQCNVALTLQT